MSLLEMKHIKKEFGGMPVIRDISLSVEQGEILAIIGPSGSGKSTLLRCATMLETIDDGEILYLGKRAAWVENGRPAFPKKQEMKEIQSCFGLVFQNFNLFPHFSVIKNITDAPIRVQKRKKEEVYEEAKKLLTKMGLADKADAYPYQLSGGQQQRVAIARVLSAKPAIILADEPTRMSGDREAQAVYDRRWTEEALFNILDNAVKYGEPGMPVCVTVTSYELFVRIDIMNYGNEIPGEEYPRIFMRYYRGGNAVFVKEGIGLGLYLSREIITDQGGYIKVSSAKGMGNVFSVFLKKR